MKKQSRRYSLIFSILAFNVIADQLTKLVAQKLLQGRPPLSLLGNSLRFQYVENRGAFLSLGATLSDTTRFWFLTILVGAFTLGCLVYILFNQELNRFATLSFSLVIGGGISNLLDRMFRTDGQVIDFVNLGIGDLRTGIFNFADVAIMVGVICLLFGNMKEIQNKKGALPL